MLVQFRHLGPQRSTSSGVGAPKHAKGLWRRSWQKVADWCLVGNKGSFAPNRDSIGSSHPQPPCFRRTSQVSRTTSRPCNASCLVSHGHFSADHTDVDGHPHGHGVDAWTLRRQRGRRTPNSTPPNSRCRSPTSSPQQLGGEPPAIWGRTFHMFPSTATGSFSARSPTATGSHLHWSRPSVGTAWPRTGAPRPSSAARRARCPCRTSRPAPCRHVKEAEFPGANWTGAFGERRGLKRWKLNQVKSRNRPDPLPGIAGGNAGD